MTHPSRRRLAAATLAIAALTLTACSGDSDGDAAVSGDDESFGDISVQLSWIKNEEFAGEFFALENGYYTDAGLGEVTLTAGPSTGAAELISGTTDVALSDAVSIGSVVASEGAPLKIIGTTFQKNPFTVLSLTDGGDIATPADLVGKRIGVQDSNTALFQALLAANDIDPADVEVVPVQYDPAPSSRARSTGSSPTSPTRPSPWRPTAPRRRTSPSPTTASRSWPRRSR
ncbi:ABC transporter substrate-binding protein [Litorihabitans aurantiacus]|uniref:Thiamine pyrimidine synthase n=1 Tax=Litorihabitans aurantiacus TaxID=1930061 RepID=A0AA37USZ9_9MICO|nr:ABC transporter substrate-binding protein [Litorihabitans aurantiacus]GMA30147.1 hypothetical protein GCM10025875_01390 [Litorihabitans aurantiacus]